MSRGDNLRQRRDGAWEGRYRVEGLRRSASMPRPTTKRARSSVTRSRQPSVANASPISDAPRLRGWRLGSRHRSGLASAANGRVLRGHGGPLHRPGDRKGSGGEAYDRGCRGDVGRPRAAGAFLADPPVQLSILARASIGPSKRASCHATSRAWSTRRSRTRSSASHSPLSKWPACSQPPWTIPLARCSSCRRPPGRDRARPSPSVGRCRPRRRRASRCGTPSSPNARLAPTKTDRSRRTVHLPALALAALREEQPRQRYDRLQAGRRWQGPRATCSPRARRNGSGRPERGPAVPRRPRRRLGLPDVPWHYLRHFAATALLEAGEDLFVVSRILGHTSVATTASFYGHVQPAMLRRSADRNGRAHAQGIRKLMGV